MKLVPVGSLLAAVLLVAPLAPWTRPAAQTPPTAPPPSFLGPGGPLPARAAVRVPREPLTATQPTAPYVAAPRRLDPGPRYRAPLRCLEPVALANLENGAEALARAQQSERAFREAKGRERLAARLDCVDAWRALKNYADAPASEGALRAARHLAALDCADEARAELEFAVAHAGAHDAHVARLELAHLERRAGRHGPALVAYEAVERDALAPLEKRDEASLWRGRVHAERGQLGDAARLWGALAERARDPVVRVRAGDWLALDALARGDGAEAAGWIARTRERAFEVSLERTPEGARVRRALARMRSLVELALAVDDGQVGRDVLFDELESDER